MLGEVKSGTTVKAKYTWLADGSKLRVRDAGSNGFDYLGSLTYTSSSSGLQLEAANFAGGTIRASGASQEINYFLTDHLGSVRVIVDGSGNVKERNDYYAFGAKHVRDDYAQNTNRYDYNGKEEQTTGDLGFLDYGARMYDAALGRWHSIDPKAEKYYSLTTYDFVGGNPIKRIDPNGEDWYFNEYGDFLEEYGSGDEVRIINNYIWQEILINNLDNLFPKYHMFIERSMLFSKATFLSDYAIIQIFKHFYRRYIWSMQ